MNSMEWLKPAVIGAVIGAAALALFGFGWNGWMTAGKSQILADEMARKHVVAALVPICIYQSKHDPDGAAKLAALKAAVSYDRNEMMMKSGWATMPGTDEPNRVVAENCVKELAATF